MDMAKVEKATLKQALQERKSELGYSNRYLGFQAGVSPATVGYACGTIYGRAKDIRLQTLQRMLEALDCKLYAVSSDEKYVCEIIQED